MNRLLHLGILLYFVSCSTGNQKENSLKSLKLNGSVKSISESSFEAIEKFGEIQKLSNVPQYEVYKTIFDKDGYATESSTFNGNGILLGKSINKYDKNRNIVEATSYYGNGIISQKSLMKYDNNKIIEDNGYDKDGNLEYKHVYSYNTSGLKTEFKYYNKDNILQSTTTYKYDKNGFMSEQSIHNALDGKQDYRITYLNSDKGDWLEYNEFGWNGFQTKNFSYKYDNDRNKIEEINLEQKENEPDRTSNIMRKYKYDKNGNEIEYQWLDLNGTQRGTFTYKYEFDLKDNWTKKIEFENSVPKEITERAIEYY